MEATLLSTVLSEAVPNANPAAFGSGFHTHVVAIATAFVPCLLNAPPRTPTSQLTTVVAIFTAKPSTAPSTTASRTPASSHHNTAFFSNPKPSSLETDEKKVIKNTDVPSNPYQGSGCPMLVSRLTFSSPSACQHLGYAAATAAATAFADQNTTWRRGFTI